MAKKKPNGSMTAEAAIDSNAAAKANGHVALKPEHIAVMDTLLAAHAQAKRIADEALARVNAYALQCAGMCGVQTKDFDLNWDMKAFVPKPGKPEIQEGV